MNATQWVTLTEFCKQMGREGILQVDDTEKGWYITWVDSSPQALARQAANQAKERADMDDEQRMRKLIAEQIEKARREKAERGDPAAPETAPELPAQVLTRDPASQPIQLSFGAKTASSASESTLSSCDPQPGPSSIATMSLSRPTQVPVQINKLKTNPLKKASNPLKAAPKKSQSSLAKSIAAPKSALESIVAEEEARKRRTAQATWSGAGGHGAEGLQLKGHRR